MNNQKLADALRALIAAEEQQENTDYLAVREMALDSAREALAEYDDRTFSDDVFYFVDRVMQQVHSTQGAMKSIGMLENLLQLAKAATVVGNNARTHPHCYQEPQA